MSDRQEWVAIPVRRAADLTNWEGPQIAVQLVLNIEHWPLSRPLPRQLLPAPHGRSVHPDVANLSWLEYGLRAGMRRVGDCLTGIDAVAVSLNSSVIRHYPEVAELVRNRGWEIVGHGTSQQSLQSCPDEVAEISAVATEVREFFGAPPAGWLGPGLVETWQTMDVLRRAEYSYILDWTLDDRPLFMTAGDGELLAIPYSLELNDSVLYAAQWYSSGELLKRFRLSLEQLEREPGPAVLSVGLHPHLIGVPHRLHELREIVEFVNSRPSSRFVAPRDIAAWVA